VTLTLGEGTVPYTVDPRVDTYIDALPDWKQAICHERRLKREQAES